jgi:glycerophosphoryl diester phosphodiesterase
MLPLAHFYPNTPLIFAHRGASADAPENTLRAFGLALEQGADALELDVTLSADGVPVVIHDDTLDRTTNGRGLVRRHRLAELKALDAGYPALFGDKFAGARLPTLDEVFAAYGHQTLINVELKQDRAAGRALAPAVIGLITRHGLAERVLISSFQFSSLRQIRALEPALPIALLYAVAAGGARLVRWLNTDLHPEAHHPGCYTLSPEQVPWFHAQGLRVNTWTVNAPEDLRRFALAGADGLITNRPGLAVAVRNEVLAA